MVSFQDITRTITGAISRVRYHFVSNEHPTPVSDGIGSDTASPEDSHGEEGINHFRLLPPTNIHVTGFYHRRVVRSLANFAGFFPLPALPQLRGQQNIPLPNQAPRGGLQANGSSDSLFWGAFNAFRDRVSYVPSIPNIGLPAFTLAIPSWVLTNNEGDEQEQIGARRHKLSWLKGNWKTFFSGVGMVAFISLFVLVGMEIDKGIDSMTTHIEK